MDFYGNFLNLRGGGRIGVISGDFLIMRLFEIMREISRDLDIYFKKDICGNYLEQALDIGVFS